MQLVKIGYERVEGVVIEGDWDTIDFVAYFVENEVYQSIKLAEGVILDDLYNPDALEKTVEEYEAIRHENIKKEAEKRFPHIDTMYYMV